MAVSIVALREYYEFSKAWLKFAIENARLKSYNGRRRGALSISDLIYLMVAIIVLANIMPIIRDYSAQGASGASGVEAVFWNMMPWIIVLGLLWTIIEKARTPRVEG